MIKGDWQGVSGTKVHQYIFFEYEDFPYTIIISGKKAGIVAGHPQNEPGIYVARDLFDIFEKEVPENIEQFKGESCDLAIRFLDIVFGKTKELHK